ncbi:MAG: alpha/beta hydrolase [Actinomycetota bacterium]
MIEQDGTSAGDYVYAGALRTYYEVRGTGEPVVMLHGGFCTIETWEAQTPALAERYRVVLPERRAHGRTPDLEGSITFANMAQDTIAFMDAIGLSRAHLVGWSDGGNVGLEVALARPDLVGKLVMMSAAANLDGMTPEMPAELEDLATDTLPPMLRDPYEALSPDGPEHLGIVVGKLKQLWSTEPNHVLQDLEGVSIPTLVMVADDDFVTVEHAAAMQRAIPDAQLAVVPGTDHALLFEKPELVNRLILDFLAEEQTPKLFTEGHGEGND